jgi:hypothetical protein
MSDITSANSIFAITVPGLFPTPIILSGYSADAAWNADNRASAEAQMGVDGRQTGGVIKNPVKQTVHFQADSPSVAVFEAIEQAQDITNTVFYLQATITLPGPGKVYSGVRGILTDVKPIPDAAKVLQPVEYVISWESLRSSII